MNEVVHLFLLALLGSIIALLGGVVFLYNRRLSDTLQRHSVPFAAGVLITVSLLSLIPEAFELIEERALLIVLASFFGAYFLEFFFVDIHHHEEGYHGKAHKAPIALVIVGDTIHNFIDGIAIAASFFANPGLGLVTAFSTFLHEIPHEIGDFGILLQAKWKRKNILIVNALSASATIVGAFLTFFVAENDLFVGTMLAISAGIFLYLGTIDFLPQLKGRKSGKLMAVLPLILGIVVMAFTLMIVPHSHEETEEEHLDEVTLVSGFDGGD